MSQATEAETPTQKRGAGTSAETAGAWLNIFLKVLVTGAVLTATIRPDLIPLLKRFAVRSSEINILGAKIQIIDLALSGSAVKLTEDGHMLIGGIDANAVPDRLAQLEQAARDLKAENDKLKQTVEELQILVQTAKTKLDEANNRLTGATSAPLATESLDRKIARASEQSAAQIASANNVAAQASKVIAEPDIAPAVGFGVVIGADATPEAAMDEVRKAQRSVANPFILFRRQGYWRSVVFFGTRTAAQDTLPTLRAGNPDAYVIDVSRWCPTPVRIAPATAQLAELKDCGF